jgi:hypothetical protein
LSVVTKYIRKIILKKKEIRKKSEVR